MPEIKIFIASSSRYKPLSEKESAKKARKRSAENAQNLIDGINQRFQQVKVVPWWDCSCFGKEEFLLDSLRTISMEYNIGIFILGPDEILDKSQGKPKAIPNSNVMFEMGMFASLGKPTFVIKDGWDKVILPSDLQGKYIFSFLEKERFYESLSNCINSGKYKSEDYKGICLYHSESLVSKLGNRTQYQNWDSKALYMGSKCTHLWAAIEKERNYKEVTFVRILIEAMQNSRNKGLKKALASVNNIISFGPGAGRVDLLLKNLFVDVNPKPSYIPVDINVGLACTASSAMMGNKYPTPFAIIDDIEEPAFYSRMRDFIDDKKLVIGSVNLFSMLGVTFSNLSMMTEDFLSNLKDIMVDKNDLFLLDVIRL